MSIKRVFSIGANTTEGSNTARAMYASTKTRFQALLAGEPPSSTPRNTLTPVAIIMVIFTGKVVLNPGHLEFITVISSWIQNNRPGFRTRKNAER